MVFCAAKIRISADTAKRIGGNVEIQWASALKVSGVVAI